MLRKIYDRFKDAVRADVLRELDTVVEARVRAALEEAAPQLVVRALAARAFVPNPAVHGGALDGPWLQGSTPSAADFRHPRYAEICQWLCVPPVFHRKQWEFVFIIDALSRAGVLQQGRRGLAFGVGRERLPALFAARGVDVVATDAPLDLAVTKGWSASNQHSDSLDNLRFPQIVENDIFDKKVRFQTCDMTAIDPALTDFDFVWSSCCFEHLGSLEAGLQFVINTVERTLRIGGVACHTTEFNLSSDDDTVRTGGTVLYRRRDFQALIDDLRARGHHVEPFVVARDVHVLDQIFDLPPYLHDPHLKLQIKKYVSTSAGIVVTRGV